MLRRVRSRTRDNDHTPTSASTPHVAYGQFAKVQCPHEVHVNDSSRGFEQVAVLIKCVVKVILSFRYTGIGDCNVDRPRIFESGTEINPTGLVAFDEFDARW